MKPALVVANASLIDAAPMLLDALLAANVALFDAAEARDYNPPVPTELEIKIVDALVAAIGEDGLRAHVERQRAKACGE